MANCSRNCARNADLSDVVGSEPIVPLFGINPGDRGGYDALASLLSYKGDKVYRNATRRVPTGANGTTYVSTSRIQGAIFEARLLIFDVERHKLQNLGGEAQAKYKELEATLRALEEAMVEHSPLLKYRRDRARR